MPGAYLTLDPTTSKRIVSDAAYIHEPTVSACTLISEFNDVVFEDVAFIITGVEPLTHTNFRREVLTQTITAKRQTLKHQTLELPMDLLTFGCVSCMHATRLVCSHITHDICNTMHVRVNYIGFVELHTYYIMIMSQRIMRQ